MTNSRNQGKKFGIKKGDRSGHLLLLGKTGMGKSTLLANIILSDIHQGEGVCVVDPHGALIEESVLPNIPAHRLRDAIYVNPADENPLPFNLLEGVPEEHHHLIASGIISIFKKIWFDAWGPKLEHILRQSILTLLCVPGATILDVAPLLTNTVYRDDALQNITDTDLLKFWRHEFPLYQGDKGDGVAPILNKIGAFSGNKILKKIVGQPKNAFDIRKAMDEQKIILVNLSRGRMGEDASSLLGAMIITKTWLAALSRQDIPDHQRKPLYLHIDEAHSITGHFAQMLSETRKYKVNVTLAFQYLDQLDPAVRSALFGNIGTIISFRVGAEDAAYLAREFYPVFSEVDFVNLPKYHMYLKLLIDGAPSRGFSAVSLPLSSGVVMSCQSKTAQLKRR